MRPARRPRYHLHVAPTYSSWLNPVERRFAVITQRAIRRCPATSPKELERRIDQFVANDNRTAQLSMWVRDWTRGLPPSPRA